MNLQFFGHVGKQPTSLNGGLESVLQISMATQITPGFSQKCHATSKFTWLTLINRSLFWARKWPTGLEGLGSVFSYFFPSDSRINLDTCKSNEKQLYLLKTPNSLQEGPVSNLQTTCVHFNWFYIMYFTNCRKNGLWFSFIHTYMQACVYTYINKVKCKRFHIIVRVLDANTCRAKY